MRLLAKQPVSRKIITALNRFESRFLTTLAVASAPIAEPSLAAIKAGGKRLRPALVIISATLGKKPNADSLQKACMAVELVHLASLIHDDVLDGSDTRRGISTIYANYGFKQAVDIGDYLFGLAFDILAECDDNPLIAHLAEASVFLSRGELRQRQSLRDLDQSLDDYLYRIYTKTSALFVASCAMGSRLSDLSADHTQRLKDYASCLGTAFQIYDDILDFTGDERILGKPVGNDIREGTVTLPMIYALKKDDGDIVAKALVDPDDASVDSAVDAVLACGAIDEAAALAQEYVDKAQSAAELLPDCQAKSDLVSLGNFVVNRYH